MELISVNCDSQILVTDDMLGISGFYPNLLKNIYLLRIIEKAIKKYSRDVKLKVFPSKKIFQMDQNTEKKWNKDN